MRPRNARQLIPAPGPRPGPRLSYAHERLYPFDTLKFATRLQEGGFTPEQAKAAAAFAEATGEELATKSDLHAEIAAVRADIRELELRMTIKLGGLTVVATGILLATIRYLPSGHP